MSRNTFIACLSLLALGGVEAHAAPGERPGKDFYPSQGHGKGPSSGRTPLHHRHQFGLGFRAGTGYRVIAPYSEGQDCGEAGERVCDGRQPAWLELSPCFGVSKSLEILVDLRIGLEDDFTPSKDFFVAPGIKYYANAESWFKIYTTAQLVLDTQEQPPNSGMSSFDLGVRSALGIQFDVHHAVGLFVQGGILFGFLRHLNFTVDFAGGIQVRY